MTMIVEKRFVTFQLKYKSEGLDIHVNFEISFFYHLLVIFNRWVNYKTFSVIVAIIFTHFLGKKSNGVKFAISN